MTYQLSPAGDAITCLLCGRTSHNPIDVRERYCGNCHRFHEDRFHQENTSMPQALKATWTVRAGVIPGKPIDEFTRTWHYTSQDHEEDQKHGQEPFHHARFSKMRAEALDYCCQVSMPSVNNWAELTFLWL